MGYTAEGCKVEETHDREGTRQKGHIVEGEHVRGGTQ